MSMRLGYLVGTAIFAALFVVAVGGLALSRYTASAVLLALMLVCILFAPQRATQKGH
jgi:uncharacterized membrane-anchored protein